MYGSFKEYLSKDLSDKKSDQIEKILGSSLISRITRVINFEPLNENSIKTLMKSYVDSSNLEIGNIEEAYYLSNDEEYQRNGVRLAYRNVRKKLLEQEKVKKQIKNG